MGKNAIVGQSGGPTSVINASLAGVFESCKSRGAGIVYGMCNGVAGLLEERVVDLSTLLTDDLDIELLKRTPSSFLGSCRYKLPDWHTDEAVYKKLFAILEKLDIGYFFYIGGNDSMDTIGKLAEYGECIQSDIRFMGVPKTIDNDLMVTDHTPGYGSAAKYIGVVMKEIIRDATVYGTKYVTVVEIMGRNAGWLTAAAALAKSDDCEGVDMICLPEVPFNVEHFIEKVRVMQEKKPSIVIAVSEGVKLEDGRYVCELADDVHAVDAFGHKALTGTARYLANVVARNLDTKTRCIELSTLQRCAGHLTSRTDITEAYQVGGAAVKAAFEGVTGQMVALKRISNSPYQCTTELHPISEVANLEKKVPLSWMNENHTQMTEEFFDYVFLGEGSPADVSASTGIPQELVERMRADVLYWYPLDINLGGKEHMTVHFPAFLFNHVAILPQEMWPRGITVNWYITGKNSDKISKSKGGAQPIPGAAAKFGVDAMRLYYAHVASMFVDVEWSEDTVMTYRQRVDRIFGAVQDLIASESDSPKGEMDAWLMSRFNTHLNGIRKAMDKYDLRQMTTIVYFDMYNDIKWYSRRGGSNSDTIRQALRIWIQAMMPVTPHTAEELWESAGFDGLVSAEQLPEADPAMISASSEYGENLIRDIMSDITEIRKIAKVEPSRIVLYTSAEWKREVMRKGARMLEEGKLTVPDLTKACMADEAIKRNGKAASELAKKVAVEFPRSTPEAKRPVYETDEFALLTGAREFLAEETGLQVDVLSADEPDVYDPQKKARAAAPGRPAILLE